MWQSGRCKQPSKHEPVAGQGTSELFGVWCHTEFCWNASWPRASPSQLSHCSLRVPTPAVCCSSAQHTLSATRPSRASLDGRFGFPTWSLELVVRCPAMFVLMVFRSLLLVFLSAWSWMLFLVLSPGLAILWTKSVSAQWSNGGTKLTTIFLLCLA